MSSLPPPTTFGFPAKFDKWRKYQDEMILDLAGSEKRFSGFVAPTGSGKSLSYMALAKLSGAARVCVLTSTKSLQNQLAGDFEGLDIRGKSNYLCLAAYDKGSEIGQGTTVEEASCQAGAYCRYRDWWEKDEMVEGKKRLIPGKGCLYYDTLKAARTEPVVVTNYSFWLASNVFGKGLGQFDLLVLDEAHAAPDELAGFLSVTVTSQKAMGFLGVGLPGEGEDSWWPWLQGAMNKLNFEITFFERKGTKEAAIRLRDLKRMAGGIGQILSLGKENWVAEKKRPGTKWESMTWDVANPAPFAERYLFRGTPRVVLSSATVREKTLRLLGIEKEESEMLEYPSTFPVERRPVWVVDGVPRMNFRTQPDEYLVWRQVIDEILRGRGDRRGIIHTVSFKRANEIWEESRFSERMVLHKGGSDGLAAGIKEYLGREDGVLVSPSASTGIDLPYDQCEFQIICKIPFPDMRSKVLRARAKVDPDYPAYLAAQVMVQSSGRGMRAEDDRCETFVVDGNFGWFMRNYGQFTPKWWRGAVKRTGKVPAAPGLVGGPGLVVGRLD